jgi:hypothetical protein
MVFAKTSNSTPWVFFPCSDVSSLDLQPQLICTLQSHHHILRQIPNRNVLLAPKELLLAPSKTPHVLRL